jgi:hypothetical protein
MRFETKIKKLSAAYLADARAPDITGFVDQLFHVAGERGALACVFDGEPRLLFSAPQPMHATYIVEHELARTILRMICARLGVLCKERTGTDISPYGAKAVIVDDVQDRKRWKVTFTNTPQRQEFLIEAL